MNFLALPLGGPLGCAVLNTTPPRNLTLKNAAILVLLSLLAWAAMSLKADWQVGPCGRGVIWPPSNASPTSTPTSSPVFSPTPSPTPSPTITGTPPTSTPTPSATMSPTATRTPVGGALTLRVDVSSAADYLGSLSQAWLADKAFAPGTYGFVQGGNSFHSSDSVSFTNDPALYQTFRAAKALQYDFALAPGKY